MLRISVVYIPCRLQKPKLSQPHYRHCIKGSKLARRKKYKVFKASEVDGSSQNHNRGGRLQQDVDTLGSLEYD